jgi:ADP-ribose pyrophosphatase YjhB (NUDIX family)
MRKAGNQAVNLAGRIKEHYLGPLKANSAINTFQWCKARLTLERPEALATVQRFEADSKFFRSLIIVLFILIARGLVENQLPITIGSAVALVLAFSRYVDQRLKSTDQSYWCVITLEGQREDGFRQPRQEQGNAISHAGGVVFRHRTDQVEYLLVQAKNAPQEWVLPKGHIEAWERMEETAVREVREETGVWARIKDKLNTISFAVNGEPAKAQFFLMEAVEAGKPNEERENVWLPLTQALGRASYEETRNLLELAEQKINLKEFSHAKDNRPTSSR